MKRGQASFEFIANYGWALIIILAVFGGFFYYVPYSGVLIPERCILGPGFECQDILIDEESISVMLANNLGETIVLTAVRFEGKNASCDHLTPLTLSPAESVVITTSENCLIQRKGGASRLTTKIEYTPLSGTYDRVVYGEIVYK